MDIGGPQQFDVNSLISQQARANRVGTVSPFGSVTYFEDQGGPRNDTRAEISLSPEQQAILDTLQGGQLQAGELAGAQLGGLEGGRSAVEDATFQRALGLLNPEFDRRERALRQRLANQGLPQESGAFTREVGRFETGVNQQLEQAALAAVLAGGQEESRIVANALALLGIAQPQQPQVFAPGQVDVLGPYRMNQQAAAQQQGFAGDIIGGLIGAGGLVGRGAFAGGA